MKALLEAVVASPSELGFDWEEREQHVEGDVCWINARGTLYVNGEATPYRVTAVLVRRDGAGAGTRTAAPNRTRGLM